ncbi:MAG TPA: hypothetical protein PKI93_05040 [Alphaproteobacteria bacterium]|nr:hypothetical protein [Alphaproteobacteria bacterium]HNS45478.1 hypothetical protein [Alphaproteobacteria bacterium]
MTDASIFRDNSEAACRVRQEIKQGQTPWTAPVVQVCPPAPAPAPAPGK